MRKARKFSSLFEGMVLTVIVPKCTAKAAIRETVPLRL
jgi:hypothetical protein